MPDITSRPLSPDQAANLRAHFLLMLPPKPRVFFCSGRWGVDHKEGTTRVTTAFPSREEAIEFAKGPAWINVVLGHLLKQWVDASIFQRTAIEPPPSRQDAESIIAKWKAQFGDDILEVDVRP